MYNGHSPMFVGTEKVVWFGFISSYRISLARQIETVYFESYHFALIFILLSANKSNLK